MNRISLLSGWRSGGSGNRLASPIPSGSHIDLVIDIQTLDR
jgi:hypothetical protein